MMQTIGLESATGNCASGNSELVFLSQAKDTIWEK
jgi:hypothetical protein